MHKHKAVVSGWGMKRARQTGWMLGLAMCVALVACVGAAKASTSVWADVGTDWHLPANWSWESPLAVLAFATCLPVMFVGTRSAPISELDSNAQGE